MINLKKNIDKIIHIVIIIFNKNRELPKKYNITITNRPLSTIIRNSRVNIIYIRKRT